MTMGGMKDYQWKEGSQPQEGKKEDDHGMDERLPREGRRST